MDRGGGLSMNMLKEILKEPAYLICTTIVAVSHEAFVIE